MFREKDTPEPLGAGAGENEESGGSGEAPSRARDPLCAACALRPQLRLDRAPRVSPQLTTRPENLSVARLTLP